MWWHTLLIPAYRRWGQGIFVSLRPAYSRILEELETLSQKNNHHPKHFRTMWKQNVNYKSGVIAHPLESKQWDMRHQLKLVHEALSACRIQRK